MASEDLFGIEAHCTICTSIIPKDRQKFRAVTCSDKCKTLWARLKRKKVEDRECLFCHKPSTPNARRAFAAFRVWQSKYPDLSHPDEWAIVSSAGMTMDEFGKAIRQSIKHDELLDLAFMHANWGSVKDPRPQGERNTAELDRAQKILAAHAQSIAEVTE